MQKKFKRLTAMALAAMMALSVSACGGSKKDENKIILGYIGPLTGESALWGEVESNTLKMLVEETNANGGIIGKQIELKIYDNRGDAVETTNAARKALQNDGVVAFIGPDSSSGAIALDEVCEEYKMCIRDRATGLPASIEWTGGTVGGVLYLALACTALSLLLQNVGQKYTNPSSASLILSLESVFGVLFGVFFFHEILNLRLITGFVLIFVAIVISETELSFLKGKKKRCETRQTNSNQREIC